MPSIKDFEFFLPTRIVSGVGSRQKIKKLVLVVATFTGMYLGYFINMISGTVFYLAASAWFLKRRAKFIDQQHFLSYGTESWCRPKDI